MGAAVCCDNLQILCEKIHKVASVCMINIGCLCSPCNSRPLTPVAVAFRKHSSLRVETLVPLRSSRSRVTLPMLAASKLLFIGFRRA